MDKLAQLKITFLEQLCRFDDAPIRLYDYQKEFLADNSTYRIVNKARQLGFSFVVAVEAVIEALLNPNYVVLVTSTSEDSAKRILNYCYKINNGMLAKPALIKASQQEMSYPNGSLIVSLPNNPSTVRGYKADRVYIDEAAHFLKDRELFQAIQPSISRGGKLTLISTPRGRANIFYDKWFNDSEYSHHRIVYTQCPDKKYHRFVNKMRKTMYDMDFRQEFLAEFMADEMAMFPRDLIEACVDASLKNSDMCESANPFFMGIDFAKRVDSTVITVVELTKEKKIVVRYIKELKQMPYESANASIPSQFGIINGIFKIFNIQKIKIDSTGVGVKLEEDLVRRFGSRVEGVRFGSIEKENLITNLRLAFERQQLTIPDNDILISQLLSLEKHTTPSGMAKYKHISGKHDDAVWSLSLAVDAAIVSRVDIKFEFVGESQSRKLNEKVFEKGPSIVAI